MLEDESGRIRLVGEEIAKAKLVSGVIIAALGMESSAGDFKVIDYCFAEMGPQESQVTEDEMDIDDGKAMFSVFLYASRNSDALNT